MKISRLECRKCRRELEGSPTDVVFVCPACLAAFAFHIPEFKKSLENPSDSPVLNAVSFFNGEPFYECKTAEFATNASGADSCNSAPSDIIFPFWLFDATPSFSSNIKNRHKSLERKFQALIPAFSFRGIQLYGFPGKIFEAGAVALSKPLDCKIRGISRDPASAFVLAWFLLYRQAGNLSDISNVSMEILHEKTILALVKARLFNNKLFFSFNPEKFYPPAALENRNNFFPP